MFTFRCTPGKSPCDPHCPVVQTDPIVGRKHNPCFPPDVKVQTGSTGGQSRSPRDTHGPIVQTGPTAGQNRSRNRDGTWRKKRSDAGKPRY